MAAATRSLSTILDRINEACVRAGRAADEVTIVGVTKGHAVEIVRKARALGLRHLGESRIQEATDKYGFSEFLNDPERPTLHLIGHLQSNKARKAVHLFDSIDSLDSVHLGETLDRLAAEQDKTLRVLIQVNTSGEAQKSGCETEQALELVEAVKSMSHLELRGLMTIGPLEGDEKATRRSFELLREIRERVAREANFPQLAELSMGMSGDFEWAIEEGATEIRLGTVLWGPREEYD
ncbi:MAG: YggS family pyridoxal phosphate-dependent enzyme [Calditrichaeota bacterium]|nr:YggS family pyridoxal phosphate-dependent enzyme [Calditrichota bacterium]MCB9391644.1 YggS family pyridoxal phosphate-dependent enzyme [Calditrichota bacterium]